MENTDIDMVISIPDTPDRAVRRGSISREGRRRPHSPDASPLGYQREEYRSCFNGRTRPVPVTGENRGTSSTGTENGHRSRASGSNALFRRAAVDKDKGKSICADPPRAARAERNPGVNLDRRNGHASRCIPSEDVRGFHASNGFSPLRGDHNKPTEVSRKGKGIADCASVSNRETIEISSDRQQSRGTKRLVRHGCISPQGIASRAKQVVDTNPNDVVSAEQGVVPKTASPIDIRDIVSEHDRGRGKRLEFSRSRVASSDAVGSEAEGWVSTRNRKLNIDNGTNRRNESDTHATSSSGFEHDVHGTSAVEREGRQQRRRKNGCTTSRASNEPEVSFISSCGEPSSSRPPRMHNHQRHGRQVLEIQDSSPDVRVFRGPRQVENNDSDMKVRQIEADEMLARELQEQLYQEATVVRHEQIDENIARLLEQEEHSRNSRNTNTIGANPGGRRRLEARLQPARRRYNHPQAPASVRARRGHARGSLHRALNLSFPNDMNIELRMDFLEQLENVIGRSGNNTHLLHMDRDFTEDDYEMLLALDENNHRHGGASTHRINNLPESIVQTDSHQETCVICLETPTVGDSIRHLPCLHKFHKDCIDPWLGRSKSCPVCKSSVT